MVKNGAHTRSFAKETPQKPCSRTIMAVLSQVSAQVWLPSGLPHQRPKEPSGGRALASTSALGLPPGLSPWWGQYLRAEGQLWVLWTSHAGGSSWLAGALCLLQANGKKRLC